MSVRLLLALFAFLLPSPVAAGCVLFKELVELDDKAGRYLRASPIEISDRRAALTIAVVVVGDMLESFNSGGLAEFLDVRRHLAKSDVTELSDLAHEDFLLRLHRTRGDLLQYGEAWGCLSRSAEDYVVSLPGHVGLVPEGVSAAPLRSQDQHPAVPQSDGPGAGSPAEYFSALWLLVGLGVVAFWLILWEARRTFMRQRHICNVPCAVETDAERIQATIADLSMVGAKVMISDGAVLPASRGASHLLLDERRVPF